MFWKRKPKPSTRESADPELEALRARLARRQDDVAALQQELFDLNRFVAEVEAYLLPLQRRLEVLRSQLAEARREAARRRPRSPHTDFADIPKSRFFTDQSDEASASTEAAPPAPEPPDEADLKALYRALAKRFHPDLAADPDEKAWRQQIMAQVNAAYAAREMQALQALASQPDRPPGAHGQKSRAALLAELQAEIERLEAVVADLERQLDELAKSPAVQLKLEVSLARHKGHNLLGQMTADLEAEIARAEAELASLRR